MVITAKIWTSGISVPLADMSVTCKVVEWPLQRRMKQMLTATVVSALQVLMHLSLESRLL